MNDEAASHCRGSVTAAIWRTDASAPVEPEADQAAALGAIESRQGVVICSGTLIATGWVLSAAHCRNSDDSWFRVSHAGRSLRVAIVRTFVHSRRDVALFALGPMEALLTLPERRVPLFRGTVGADWVGREVILGGVGATETGDAGERRFVAERVVSVSAEQIVVDGGGVQGACFGDSGGPLLWSTPWELIGVLSSGATSCVGLDRYERADIVADWIQSTIEGADPCR